MATCNICEYAEDQVINPPVPNAEAIANMSTRRCRQTQTVSDPCLTKNSRNALGSFGKLKILLIGSSSQRNKKVTIKS